MKKVIDDNSPVPKYIQLQKIIEEQILSGQLKDGDKIPSEKELGEMYSVSRMTVRNALNLLTEDHLLYSVAGIGSFVKYPIIGNSLVRIIPFSETILEQGKSGYTKILRSELIKDEPVGNIKLKRNMDEPVGRLDLIGYLEDLPIVYYSSYYIKDVFKEFSEAARILEIENKVFSSFDIYKHLGYSYSNIEQKIYVILSDIYISKYLMIEPNSPLLVLETIYYDSNGSPIEFKKGYYRGDKYVFDLKRSGS